jgi:hypothetical protein
LNIDKGKIWSRAGGRGPGHPKSDEEDEGEEVKEEELFKYRFK